ncbi:MAG: Ku protein [Limisphaerales bacterium]
MREVRDNTRTNQTTKSSPSILVYARDLERFYQFWPSFYSDFPFPATRREELKFRLLRKSDLSPINYKRIAEADGKEVPWDQIVEGYEYEKDKFIVLKDDELRQKFCYPGRGAKLLRNSY